MKEAPVGEWGSETRKERQPVSVSKPATAAGNWNVTPKVVTGMGHLHPPSRKDLLPRCRECGEQMVPRCQLLWGLPQGQRAALLKVMPFPEQPAPANQARQGGKGQPFPPDPRHVDGESMLQSFPLGWPSVYQACIATRLFLSFWRGWFSNKHTISQTAFKHLLPEILTPNHPSRETRYINHKIFFCI